MTRLPVEVARLRHSLALCQDLPDGTCQILRH